MQLFIYQLKILLRNKPMVFWTIVFPLILATFFNLAFSKLTGGEKFDIVKIAVVEESDHPEFKSLLTSLSKEDEHQMLDVQYVNKKTAKELLENEDISAYLLVTNDIDIVVNGPGINETIIQAIVNNYYQMTSAYTNIYELNKTAFIEGVLADVSLNTNYFKETTNKNTDVTVIYFYTLIGMACMYGGNWGLTMTSLVEPNLSREGTRIAISPVSKFKALLTGFLASFICQLIAIFILLLYLVYGLHISFGEQTKYIMLLMMVGSFVGVSFGQCIASLIKGTENKKNAILTMISMLFSFLAGMMVIDIKYLILQYAPPLAYINPVSLITDALYSLYYYTNLDRYFLNLLCLTFIGICFSAISLFVIRRKKYDSI